MSISLFGFTIPTSIDELLQQLQAQEAIRQQQQQKVDGRRSDDRRAAIIAEQRLANILQAARLMVSTGDARTFRQEVRQLTEQWTKLNFTPPGDITGPQERVLGILDEMAKLQRRDPNLSRNDPIFEPYTEQLNQALAQFNAALTVFAQLSAAANVPTVTSTPQTTPTGRPAEPALNATALRVQIDQVRSQLEALGFGAGADASTLRTVSDLWKRLGTLQDQLQKAVAAPGLATGATPTTTEVTPAQIPEVSPEIKAFLAQHYGDTQDVRSFGDVRPAMLPPANLTPQVATSFANDIVQDFFGLPLNDTFFGAPLQPGQPAPPDNAAGLRRETLVSMATNHIIEAGGDVEKAQSAMMRSLMTMPEGVAPVVRELRIAFQQAVAQNVLPPNAVEKFDALVQAMGPAGLMPMIQATLAQNPEASQNDVTRQLFVNMVGLVDQPELVAARARRPRLALRMLAPQRG